MSNKMGGQQTCIAGGHAGRLSVTVRLCRLQLLVYELYGALSYQYVWRPLRRDAEMMRPEAMVICDLAQTFTAAGSLGVRVYRDDLCVFGLYAYTHTHPHTECCSVVVGTGERTCYASFDYHSSLVYYAVCPLAHIPLSLSLSRFLGHAHFLSYALSRCRDLSRERSLSPPPHFNSTFKPTPGRGGRYSNCNLLTH